MIPTLSENVTIQKQKTIFPTFSDGVLFQNDAIPGGQKMHYYRMAKVLSPQAIVFPPFFASIKDCLKVACLYNTYSKEESEDQVHSLWRVCIIINGAKPCRNYD